MKKIVIFGFLGTTLDIGRVKNSNRWNVWRPTISACWQENLHVDKYVLLYQKSSERSYHLIREDIRQISPSTEVIPQVIDLKNPWDFQEVYTCLYDIAKEYKFNLDKEDYLVNITTGTHVAQICLFLLTEAKYFPAKLLQVNISHEPSRRIKGECSIIDLDLSNYDPIAARFHQEELKSIDFLKAGIQTKNDFYNKLIAKIETVSIRSTGPILLMGNSGVGKTQLARRIYQLKKLKLQVDGPYVEVNCATLKGDAVMSTLFGHIKGSFTGALKDRSGLLLKANKGLLFLDEIGELGLDEQSMLLRALEEKRFLPLGADQEVQSDFQLIAGTNRDLEIQINHGKFREDLYNRINLWSFYMPDLKDRPEDIIPNIEYELDSFSEINKRRVRFATGAQQRFIKFALNAKWSGNFRELHSCITRLGTLAENGKISIELVNSEIALLNTRWSKQQEDYPYLNRFLSKQKIDNIDLFDRCQLDFVLKICLESKNLAKAGAKLYQQSRSKRKSINDSDRLKKYLNKFGIEMSDLG